MIKQAVKDYWAMIAAVTGLLIAGLTGFDDLKGDLRVLTQDVQHLETRVTDVQDQGITRDKYHDGKTGHDGMVGIANKLSTQQAVTDQKVDQALQGISELKALALAEARRDRESRQ